MYSYDAALGWVPTLASYAQKGRIYAQKPWTTECPQATAFGLSMKPVSEYINECPGWEKKDTSENCKIGNAFSGSDFWAIQTAMGVFEVVAGRFVTANTPGGGE
jgi:hypothetical protein